MTGIDFVDTIVVRRSVEKGTKIISEVKKPSNWAGQEFKAHSEKMFSLAGDVSLSSGKGTSSMKLSVLAKTKIPDISGRHIVTGRGTGFRLGG